MAEKRRLSRDARDVIEAALVEDAATTWTELGARVGAHRSTVEREVNSCGGRKRYSAAAAQAQCERNRRRPRDSVLAAPTALRATVEAALNAKQSPGAIAADLRAEGGVTVCSETIYQAVYGGVFDIKAKDCLRRRRVRRRGRQVRHENRRAGLPNIGSRPAIVNDRGEVGHFEMDLIIGQANKSAMLVALERATRYSALVTLPEGYCSEMVLAAMVELFEQVPAGVRRSVTFDQGSEWADWETLVATFGIDVWFCEPHSPWQRGAVENHNGHVRYWYPRGTPLAGVAPEDADRVAALLNGQRRRILGWTRRRHGGWRPAAWSSSRPRRELCDWPVRATPMGASPRRPQLVRVS